MSDIQRPFGFNRVKVTQDDCLMLHGGLSASYAAQAGVMVEM